MTVNLLAMACSDYLSRKLMLWSAVLLIAALLTQILVAWIQSRKVEIIEVRYGRPRK